MSRRIIWIDNAKFIGIFVVVLGHLTPNMELQTFIYSFHMPFFFLLSGITFNARENSFVSFFKKRFKAILVPYIFFGLITYFYWLFIARYYGADARIIIPWYKPLIGMLYSAGSAKWLIHNIPLWFLTCLFLTQLLFFLILKTVKFKKIVFPLLFILAYLFSYFNSAKLMWSINVVPVATMFFAIGYYIKLSLIHI